MCVFSLRSSCNQQDDEYERARVGGAGRSERVQRAYLCGCLRGVTDLPRVRLEPVISDVLVRNGSKSTVVQSGGHGSLRPILPVNCGAAGQLRNGHFYYLLCLITLLMNCNSYNFNVIRDELKVYP